jgi:hypothetical protein
MAVLTDLERQELRAALCRNTTEQTWTRVQVDAALQAVEDRMRLTSTENAIGGDIESAAPGLFNAAQKRLLFGVWCVSAARRLGIL